MEKEGNNIDEKLSDIANKLSNLETIVVENIKLTNEVLEILSELNARAGRLEID